MEKILEIEDSRNIVGLGEYRQQILNRLAMILKVASTTAHNVWSLTMALNPLEPSVDNSQQ